MTLNFVCYQFWNIYSIALGLSAGAELPCHFPYCQFTKKMSENSPPHSCFLSARRRTFYVIKTLRTSAVKIHSHESLNGCLSPENKCICVVQVEPLSETRIYFGRFLFLKSYKDARVGSEVDEGNEI